MNDISKNNIEVGDKNVSDIEKSEDTNIKSNEVKNQDNTLSTDTSQDLTKESSNFSSDNVKNDVKTLDNNKSKSISKSIDDSGFDLTAVIGVVVLAILLAVGVSYVRKN